MYGSVAITNTEMNNKEPRMVERDYFIIIRRLMKIYSWRKMVYWCKLKQ